MKRIIISLVSILLTLSFSHYTAVGSDNVQNKGANVITCFATDYLSMNAIEIKDLEAQKYLEILYGFKGIKNLQAKISPIEIVRVLPLRKVYIAAVHRIHKSRILFAVIDEDSLKIQRLSLIDIANNECFHITNYDEWGFCRGCSLTSTGLDNLIQSRTQQLQQMARNAALPENQDTLTEIRQVESEKFAEYWAYVLMIQKAPDIGRFSMLGWSGQLPETSDNKGESK
ncbi:MAG: hypothetical protein ACM3PP_01470 [Candidatus Saccharibacteria bacterium]